MARSVLKRAGLSRLRSRLKNLVSNVGEDLNVLIQGPADESADPIELPVDEKQQKEETLEASIEYEEQLDAEAQDAECRIEADNALIENWRVELEQLKEDRRARKAEHPLMIEGSYEFIQNLISGAAEREAELAKGEEAGEADALDEAAPASGDETAVVESEPEPEVESFSQEEVDGFQKPPLSLLREAVTEDVALVQAEELEEQKVKLQDTLDSFAVDAFVYDAMIGPRITQYRVKPGFGVRVESIAALDKNISLGLAVNAVRIQAPIPGEAFVGVEVPNGNTIPLTLRSALESKSWRESDARIPLALGMDITGHIKLCDLAAAPHLLIAGATGSGKSVCINNLLLSLIYRFKPDELELVLIDPKKVEFAMYQGLPHLIHPVVSEPKQACQALKWLVREMESRYEELSTKKVRNIAGYNEKAEAEGFTKLPYIVLIIDELADLMMTAADDIEGPIARLAQMSRAVGIHTVLATQRPSVNVITGVIKANYPTRIAFQVSSIVDSRTILDSKGAESLQGRGDMLYNPPGLSRLVRLQAPYVDDDEINQVVEMQKTQLEPRYRVKFKAEDAPGGEGAGGADGEGVDELLKQAIEIVATTKRASTSYLQRRLKIGYNRAANLVEELEQRRYIGPQVGSNPREVYVEPGEFTL